MPGRAAPVDRRVEVLEGSDEQRASLRRVSDLRSARYVVVLGEPGIGKSTVFKVEAEAARVTVCKVRELMTGVRPEPDQVLFLDALDEYRSDGQAADKMYEFAKALSASAPVSWRLSCRSEDWRKEADVAPVKRAVGGASILVVQLLPLNKLEAIQILASLGEADPEGFFKAADSMGAAALLENPLSLMLLQKVRATGGALPATRFELFASAVDRLAYERNPEHKWRSDRSAPSAIVAGAAEACLILLASGSSAVWRSNDEPPVSEDVRRYVTAHELGLTRALLDDVLDTALFRGEGEAFEPVHRTIAEFLGGQALARLVVPDADRAALPFSRALAMITGADGRAPTELRGLYAWFGAHLARFGDGDGAARLATSDAVTVLAYGDAAMFPVDARRAILANLDRDDPYFRGSDVGVTAIGGLADEDLATEFADALSGEPDAGHRRYTVLEVLKTGRPVHSLRPLLRSMALDPAKPEWERWRAAEAWLNGAGDRVEGCRSLLDAVAPEPVSIGRESLRAHLAAELPAEALSLADVKSILSDFRRMPDDNTIGRLIGLQHRLESAPKPELFDEPLDGWLPTLEAGDHRHEVEGLVDRALAAAIRQTLALTAERLWRWIVNTRQNEWSEPDRETIKAVGDWLDGGPGREAALFEAMLAARGPEDRPWLVGHDYVQTAARNPSTAIVLRLLERADAASTLAETRRLQAVAVDLSRSSGSAADAFWATYDHLAARRGTRRLLRTLTVSMLEPWRLEQARGRRKTAEKASAAKAANTKVLTPLIAGLKAGRHPGHLDWAARLYFHGSRTPELQPDAGRLLEYTDQGTANALLEGWKHLATVEVIDVDPVSLGTADAGRTRYFVEWAAIAGLDQLLETEETLDLATMPLVLALVVLRSGYIVGPETRRARLTTWALQKLNLDASSGAAALTAYWETVLDRGACPDIAGRLAKEDARGPAVAVAVEQVLTSRPSLPLEALRSLLSVADNQLGRDRLLELAAQALADHGRPQPQRRLWSFVAFTLDPVAQSDRFMTEHQDEEWLALFDEHPNEWLVRSRAELDSDARAKRAATLVRLFGRLHPPDDDYSERGSSRRGRMSEVVRGLINELAGDSGSTAGPLLDQLAADAELAPWRNNLRHARAQQARVLRDRDFRHPSPATIRAALEGGPPVNAADLRAVVTEQLRRLGRGLHGDTTAWKHYWNVDAFGNPTTPKIENQCRDLLLDRLRDRLGPYKIAAALPEARRGEETRSDVLILSGAGSNLPLEAKRHFHPDVWTAAATQLRGYAEQEGADGHGIYLVFWFGNDAAPTPARPDGACGPSTAVEFERMLGELLPPPLHPLTDMVVFDVSRPTAAKAAGPRRKRRSRQTASEGT